MKYPEWAPLSLVELYERKSDPALSGDTSQALDPESILADILQKADRAVSEDNIENLRRQLYRNVIGNSLPPEEELALLEKLIADQRMKTVWAALSKRSKDQHEDPLQFFSVCQRGIAGWRGDPKQTPAERKAFYQDLYDAVVRLDVLMNEAAGLDFYSIEDLIQDSSIETITDASDIPPAYSSDATMESSYLKFSLSEIMPSFHTILRDISEKAILLRDEAAPIKKPNSQKAGAHFFIRMLSGYLRNSYGQPLNEVVALTASVVFELPNCDESYVRKIAKP